MRKKIPKEDSLPRSDSVSIEGKKKYSSVIKIKERVLHITTVGGNLPQCTNRYAGIGVFNGGSQCKERKEWPVALLCRVLLQGSTALQSSTFMQFQFFLVEVVVMSWKHWFFGSSTTIVRLGQLAVEGLFHMKSKCMPQHSGYLYVWLFFLSMAGIYRLG